MSHIFISYVEEDGWIARDIARGLEAVGYDIWYYERDGIAPGVRYTEQIVRAIQRSQAFILVVSRHSLSSRQLDAEVICAFESGKSFIPVRLGLTHDEIQQRQPGWRLPLRDAVSIAVPEQGAGAILPQIIRGLESLSGAEPDDYVPPGSALSSGEQNVAAEVSEFDELPVRALDRLRGVAAVEVPKFHVFWWQWILAGFVIGSQSPIWAFLFSLLVPAAVLAGSHTAQLGNNSPIGGGIGGSFIAGTFGGVAGWFATFMYPEGAVFGLAFGLINGTYLRGMFRKGRRQTTLLRACVVTLTTVAFLSAYLYAEASRHGSSLAWSGDDLWRALLGSLCAVLGGLPIDSYLNLQEVSGR